MIILEKNNNMASETDHQVPMITISDEMLWSGQKSKEWVDVAERVRVACERHGWFLVHCEEISSEVQEKMFEVTKEMFGFPEEKKQMYNKALKLQGSKVFDSVNTSVLQLCNLLLRMISDSYGIQEYYEKKAFDENSTCIFRAIKYRLPKSDEGSLGFQPHVDKNLFAVLIQNSVQGLQGLARDGNWVFPNIPKGAVVIIAGDALQVLSNGRIRALKHRVVMSGSKERYSCGFNFIPKKEVILEVPLQLIDDHHPPLYHPVLYSEYREKCLKNPSSDALDNFAGII